jgi:hypothetical protein
LTERRQGRRGTSTVSVTKVEEPQVEDELEAVKGTARGEDGVGVAR